MNHSPLSSEHAVIQHLCDIYRQRGDSVGAEGITRAYEYAVVCHAGILRKSGEPYITHPIAAAQEVIKIDPDADTVIATLLHDVISYGTGKFAEIEKKFGTPIANIVHQITIIGRAKYHGQESTIPRMQKMLLAVTEDIRVLFVKLAERIHNLQTLQYHTHDRAREIAEESLFVYAPIAARLGLYGFRDTIESLAFRTIDLDAYLRITGELAHYTVEQEQFLTQSITRLRDILPDHPYDISYRIKKPYSIYRKMQERNLKSVFEMYDVFAMRILVNSVSECYEVLGHIHGHFLPVPGRFKDFIAVPKLNGYQSLHTTVLGLASQARQPVEIQIRTRAMNADAEHGIAAHVLYKQFQEDAHKKTELQNVLTTLTDGLTEAHPSFGKKEHLSIFVLTPKGDVRELPQGATPIDFAYSIHSNIGYHTTGARVNSSIVTLDTRLRNGDIVEIITQPQAHPSAQWLDFVVSSKARAEIGIEIKKISGDRDRIIARGRQDILTLCRERCIEMDQDCQGLKKYLDYSLDQKKLEELLYQVGQGIRKPGSFFPVPKKIKSITEPTKKSAEEHAVIIGSESLVPHERAQCCMPTFPTPIIAVMRSGGRCMLHTTNCGNLSRVNPARILPAYWSTPDTSIVETLTITLRDQPGILAALTQLVYQAGINISEVQTIKRGQNNITIRLSVELPYDMGDVRTRLIERIQMTLSGIEHIE